MRTTVALAAFALFASFAPADDKKAAPKKWSAGPLAEARQRLLKGNYEEARAAFEEAAKRDAKLAPAAAVGVSKTYREVGEYDKAHYALKADGGKTGKNNRQVLNGR